MAVMLHLKISEILTLLAYMLQALLFIFLFFYFLFIFIFLFLFSYNCLHFLPLPPPKPVGWCGVESLLFKKWFTFKVLLF